jgi:hypothetical protein
MLHFELYLLGLAGVAIHYLKDWVAHQKKGVKYGFAKSVPMIILSTITTMLLVYLREDIESLYVITPFSAVITGYVGNSLFFSFVDAKLPKTPIDDEAI